MKKLSWLLLAVVAALFGAYVAENGGLTNLKLPGGISLPGLGTSGTSSGPIPARVTDTIRIATWNIEVFGESKLQKPAAMNVIVSVLRNFDVIAIQELRAVSQEVVPELVAQLNADGQHHYDYVLGPRLGRTSSKEQYVFVFDMATIEVDRNQLYTVDDSKFDLLHREPLVGWFRARGAPPEQAFTFTLVNVHTDPEEVDRELDALADVYLNVQGDARQEDDTIMLGDFNANDRNLRRLGQIAGLRQLVVNTPTNTLQNAMYDNMIFLEQSTPEFTGRGGVFDFLREYNLSRQQATEVSDHLPLWAEFSVFEGGRAGPVATRGETFPTQ
jgi:endonuclease/exonuclease/phosphatase family metal-dependent hydrolase